MSSYTYELAFDWDTAANVLENDLMYMDQDKFGEAQSGARLQVGDTIQFPIYDNSSKDHTSGCTITGWEIRILDAETGDPADPFSPSLPSFQSSVPMSKHDNLSQFYGECESAWPIGDGQYKLTKDGRYEVSLAVTVAKGDETKRFTVDPEWIVGDDPSPAEAT